MRCVARTDQAVNVSERRTTAHVIRAGRKAMVRNGCRRLQLFFGGRPSRSAIVAAHSKHPAQSSHILQHVSQSTERTRSNALIEVRAVACCVVVRT